MPNWNDRVEQELRSLDRLLSVTLTLESRFASVEWDLRAAVILGRIRRLYFDERGALGFLRHLAEGEAIPETERLRLRALHDSFEAEMEAAADALRLAASRNGVRIDMDAMGLLEGLVHDSTCIRDTVFGMFSAPVGALIDTEASRRDARFILDGLEPRLIRFREADVRLRLRAKSHGVELPSPEIEGEDAEAESEAEAEAREAAEARAAFIGAALPSAAAGAPGAPGARRSGIAGTLRNMVSRDTLEGPAPGDRRNTDWQAEPHPDQQELPLEGPPRSRTRAQAVRRRWATRRRERAAAAEAADAKARSAAAPAGKRGAEPEPARWQAASPPTPVADRAARRVVAPSSAAGPRAAPAPAPPSAPPAPARDARATGAPDTPSPAAEAPPQPERGPAPLAARPAAPPAPVRRRWFGLARLLGLEDAPAAAPPRREPSVPPRQRPAGASR
ncbi:hypothetical protein SAMN05444336_104240 [Albimonas donghaensis]|uniref:Uncharacterized protein n=1 Tax=Albimonas donghaensis TaxID=356660 RepID=A0A1H3ALS5_9RHOB|nr:hypothetical protein [Albimonas donghaensis]SDX30555.1 hypothetical protein SAMN05444336_104240 [Albimonas donghaensis]